MKKYAILILILVALVLTIGSFIYYRANLPHKEIEKKIKDVKTEKEVIEIFGNPYRTVYKDSKDYYIEGYSFKKREISNKALIYFPKNPNDVIADLILYVYIDDKGQVEDYFVGGS